MLKGSSNRGLWVFLYRRQHRIVGVVVSASSLSWRDLWAVVKGVPALFPRLKIECVYSLIQPSRGWEEAIARKGKEGGS